MLSGQTKKRGGKHREEQALEDRQEYQPSDDDSSREEQEVSKTSQNQKVAKAMKGQKEAKAIKAKTAKEPRAKKEAIPYVFKPLAKSFTGIAGKADMNGKLLKHVPFHQVSDGKTACGYDVTTVSKGLTTYGLNWHPVTGEKVNCGRCMRGIAKANAPKKEKAEKAKKPTPISKGKAKKAKSAAMATAANE